MLKHALIGLVQGLFIGTVCWWLYGLAHSLNYHGIGMDPVLRHWLWCMGGTLSILGFLFKDQGTRLWEDALSAILHFEVNDMPGPRPGRAVMMVFMAIVIAATWFSLRS